MGAVWLCEYLDTGSIIDTTKETVNQEEIPYFKDMSSLDVSKT